MRLEGNPYWVPFGRLPLSAFASFAAVLSRDRVSALDLTSVTWTRASRAAALREKQAPPA